METRDPADPVAVLERWEASGGEWRVLGETAQTLTVALCTCTGGEEVDRLVVRDPGARQWVRARRTERDGCDS